MKKIAILCWNIKELFLYSNYKRDDKIILFGAWFGEKFADNSRFLFQYLSDNKEQLGLKQVVWVTRNENVLSEIKQIGYEAYYMDSAESIAVHRKAGVQFVCNGSSDDLNNPRADVLGRYSLCAKKVNLWHGILGIKGISFTSNEYIQMKKNHPVKAKLKASLRRSTIARKMLASMGGWGDCYFVVTSDNVAELTRQSMILPQSRIIKTGYARNGRVRLLPQETAVKNKLESYEIVILYLPTFRDTTTEYKHPLESLELKNWLRANNAVWIEKPHSASKDAFYSKNIYEDNIIRLNPNFDICTIMPCINLLVTDYSSAMCDAMYHCVPVIYYVPDFDTYMKSDRGFILPPEQFIAGKKAFNLSELLELLNLYLSDKDALFLNNYCSMRDFAWESSKDIAEIWKDISAAIGLDD